MIRDVFRLTVECYLDPRDEVGDLTSLVPRIGEQEPEQALTHELANRPEVRGHSLLPRPGIGNGNVGSALDGCPWADRVERTGRKTEAIDSELHPAPPVKEV